MATQLTPLKVDPEADRLISDGAHFLGMTKKDLVAEAVRVYPEIRRGEIRARVREAMALLDGTDRSRLALLTGLTPEQIDAVGGTGEDL
ncbi:hypothetical protein FDG2_5527 [Candidatus Protofrankia californiensis]|uniref:Uncharacterized protein n=1 Tax=Candidatus Protofrankia californiensis TaxID=1839754 RepID=A0A1C3PE90_9ACTN|nr:hypothetical protein FDG2_5527 [Candidatus Protofrankia californiensis]